MTDARKGPLLNEQLAAADKRNKRRRRMRFFMTAMMVVGLVLSWGSRASQMFGCQAEPENETARP